MGQQKYLYIVGRMKETLSKQLPGTLRKIGPIPIFRDAYTLMRTAGKVKQGTGCVGLFHGGENRVGCGETLFLACCLPAGFSVHKVGESLPWPHFHHNHGE